MRRLMRAKALTTVCEEARCPNIHECWGTHGTATFMILGSVCTRRCRFCSVHTGLPTELDLAEPERVAEAVAEMQLRHVVVTMVNRDDLSDGGAEVCAATVAAIRAVSRCSVELLSSDLGAAAGPPDGIAQGMRASGPFHIVTIAAVRPVAARLFGPTAKKSRGLLPLWHELC